MSVEATFEQRKAMHEIGQKVVDMLGDELDAKGLDDLHWLISILVSVSAHYIAGISDENIRNEVYSQFCDGLRDSIAAHVEAGKGAPIHVFDTTKKPN
jgi:hypothetical protein